MRKKKYSNLYFHPMLSFQILSTLLKKGLFSYEDGQNIVRNSLPEEMPTEEKEKIVNSLVIKTGNENINKKTNNQEIHNKPI